MKEEEMRSFSQTFEGVRIARSQGVEVELRHALPGGWTVECRDSDYVIQIPRSEEWRHQLWQLVEFLSYDELSAMRRIDWPGVALSYEFVSATEDGSGFRINFLVSE